MTKAAKLVLSSIFGAFLAGVPLLAQQDVKTDFNHRFEFNKIKSYTWAKVQATDPLVEPRITIAVDRILQGEGWHLVDKNPSVYVTAVEATGNPREYARFYSGLTGYTWKPAWDEAGFMDTSGSVRQIPVGTLVIDMYSSQTNRLVWRGTASEPTEGNEKKKVDDVDKSVGAMMKAFPWKQGGKVAPNEVSMPNSNSGTTPTGTMP